MKNKWIGVLLTTILISCEHKEKPAVVKNRSALTEFSDYYDDPVPEKFYSQQVSDTFQVFTSLPKRYADDPTQKYPLILLLDGNGFIESLVSELKFNTYLGVVPKAVIVGIGYKDFATMDSLRGRDYTYPVGLPEYEFSISGGANKFKKFIDDELLVTLSTQYRIDLDKSVLCGHSLGGYFALFYLFTSAEENRYSIKNIVSASPSLHYNHRYLFEMVKNLKANDLPAKIYISMGSEDMADEESKGVLDAFEKQLLEKNYKGLKLKKAEYTNFGHIDAAMPGFIKGITYVFEK